MYVKFTRLIIAKNNTSFNPLLCHSKLLNLFQIVKVKGQKL